MKTRTVSQKDIQEKWFVIDAAGQRLGRVATVAAELLLAKNDPSMRANLMPRTKVVVVNASRLDIPSKRMFQKVYTSYSGYPGGLRLTSLEEMIAKDPRQVVEKAVRGMLPKNKRGKSIHADNLYVYGEAAHKHEAQQPQTVELSSFKI